MAYRVFFEEAINPFCLLDGEGRVVDWNHKAEKVFGFSRQEVVGKLDPTFPDAQTYHDFLQEVKEKGETVRTFTLLTRDGKELDIEVTAVYRNGEYFLMKRDLTPQRYAYLEKMKALGELAAGIAHQLNSPLNAILLITEVMEADLQDHPSLEDLKMIRRQALHMKSVIEKILNYVRVHEVKEPCCLALIARDIADLYRKSLDQHRIVFHIESSGPDPCADCTFIGDRSGIEQVIMNLVSNAVDAMPEGGKIEIRCGREGDHVVLRVKDEGIGIPPENLRRIFQPFFTTKGSKGTGLGLAIVERIVENHGGRIEVHSEVGEGTEFVVRFPLHQEANHD